MDGERGGGGGRGMEVGGGGGGGREREIIYTYRYTVTTAGNDFCIKVGSDESHLNCVISVRDKVTRQCPQTTSSEEKVEPKQI